MDGAPDELPSEPQRLKASSGVGVTGTAEAMPFRFVPSDGMSGWIGEKLIPHPTSLRMMVWVMRGDMSGLQPSSF